MCHTINHVECINKDALGTEWSSTILNIIRLEWWRHPKLRLIRLTLSCHFVFEFAMVGTKNKIFEFLFQLVWLLVVTPIYFDGKHWGRSRQGCGITNKLYSPPTNAPEQQEKWEDKKLGWLLSLFLLLLLRSVVVVIYVEEKEIPTGNRIKMGNRTGEDSLLHIFRGRNPETSLFRGGLRYILHYYFLFVYYLSLLVSCLQLLISVSKTMPYERATVMHTHTCEHYWSAERQLENDKNKSIQMHVFEHDS